MESAVLFPLTKWAQRKAYVFVTIYVADLVNQKIDLTPEGKLTFSAEAGGQNYGFALELFDGVKLDESKWNTKGRNIILNIKKANEEAEYWPRLTKEKLKNSQIQIDWSRWVDEDDEGQDDG